MKFKAERADDLQYLGELAAMVQTSARCDIGQTSPQPLLDVLEQAPQQHRQAVRQPEERHAGENSMPSYVTPQDRCRQGNPSGRLHHEFNRLI